MYITIIFIVILFVLIFILILNYNKQKNIESFQVCGRGNLNRREIWTNTKDRYGEKEALNIFLKHTYFHKI